MGEYCNKGVDLNIMTYLADTRMQESYETILAKKNNMNWKCDQDWQYSDESKNASYLKIKFLGQNLVLNFK